MPLGIDVSEKSVFYIQGVVLLIFAILGFAYYPYGCFLFALIGIPISFIIVKIYVSMMKGSVDRGGRE